MQLDARLTESVLMFLLTLVQAVREAEAVSCFEGACADDLTQCSECEGSGCVRATRLESRDTFRSVTLTCLPQEREFVAEPEGCRRHTNSDGRICICYSDWCNSAPTQLLLNEGAQPIGIDLTETLGEIKVRVSRVSQAGSVTAQQAANTHLLDGPFKMTTAAHCLIEARLSLHRDSL
uniref:Activin types I and II receptor domain-containing protein n=1 Tax=Plectus sambesii TaxID=2011161 RepID=A0A914WCN0_9BILA